MTPTPKDIEAAEKLKNSLNRRLVSGPFGKLYPETAIVEIAQDLAAAREDGRREGIEIAADDLEKFAMVVELLSTRDDATQSANDLRAAAKKLRNLPTNAPEGESDGWNFDIDQIDGTHAHYAILSEGVCYSPCMASMKNTDRVDWLQAGSNSQPIPKSKITAFKYITLPTKEQDNA